MKESLAASTDLMTELEFSQYRWFHFSLPRLLIVPLPLDHRPSLLRVDLEAHSCCQS